MERVYRMKGAWRGHQIDTPDGTTRFVCKNAEGYGGAAEARFRDRAGLSAAVLGGGGPARRMLAFARKAG